MIRHKEARPEQLIAFLQQAPARELWPERADGEDTPMEERQETGLHVAQMAADPSKVGTFCIACEQGFKLLDAVICVCGGAVCPRCLAIEGEGSCEHERPAWLPAEEDDD